MAKSMAKKYKLYLICNSTTISYISLLDNKLKTHHNSYNWINEKQIPFDAKIAITLKTLVSAFVLGKTNLLPRLWLLSRRITLNPWNELICTQLRC